MKCKSKNCNANALKNDSRCYYHSSIISESEKTANRSKGGKSKIIKAKKTYKNYSLKSVADVMNLNEQMINDVLANKLDLRICTGLAFCLNLQIKSIETSDIETRLEKIEKININIIHKNNESL